MKVAKIVAASLFIFVFAFLFPNLVKASEGTIELRSTTADDYRCFAASLKMQDGTYHIPISCRDLIYPAGPDIFSYVVWANLVGGGNPLRLGSLGFGKAEFKTKTAFTTLFVTTETSSKTKTPQGQVVMRGVVQPITFLERPTTPTPAPEGEEVAAPEVQKLSTRERLLLGLRRAGLAALLALVALVGLVFVLTRGRR